jgi:hypothetical protein
MTATRNFNLPIRNNHSPLTLDQIRRAAPSAFATEPYHDRSSRYAFIPTIAVVEGLRQYGFQPFAATQSVARNAAKQNYTKHMIRFRPANAAAITTGQRFPEVVLINSHDGSSRYKLMAGIFELICSNGLVIADSLIGSINVMHTGNIVEEVASGSVQIVQHMPKAIDAVARWQQIQLSQAEQSALAEAAHVVRFADAEGKVATPIAPAQLLAPRRYADNGADLWSTFNRVQENVIRGGVTAHSAGRRTTTRAIKGIDQDVKLNRALWTLAEKMAAIKGNNA